MCWSYIPRWKFTDSCGRPRVPGGIHVGCAHDCHVRRAEDFSLYEEGLRKAGLPE